MAARQCLPKSWIETTVASTSLFPDNFQPWIKLIVNSVLLWEKPASILNNSVLFTIFLWKTKKKNVKNTGLNITNLCLVLTVALKQIARKKNVLYKKNSKIIFFSKRQKHISMKCVFWCVALVAWLLYSTFRWCLGKNMNILESKIYCFEYCFCLRNLQSTSQGLSQSLTLGKCRFAQIKLFFYFLNDTNK